MHHETGSFEVYTVHGTIDTQFCIDINDEIQLCKAHITYITSETHFDKTYTPNIIRDEFCEVHIGYHVWATNWLLVGIET
jgi:hypothetical protein